MRLADTRPGGEVMILAAATGSTLATVGVNSRALWYMTRGFGIVAMLLLTLTTVLGLAQVARYARPGLPRFVISALHKNASLLAVVAIAVHVATAVLDTFAPVHLIDVFIPFASRYRPFWTGMGALAFDLMLAVVITSLLRERIGHRAWRAVHWAAYASWPVALLHGLGTGSDSKMGWVLFLYVACTIAVVAALWWRLSFGWTPGNSTLRGTAIAVSVVVPVAIAGWAASGPLRAGWARQAGTPPSLLASGASPAASSSQRSSAAGASPGPGAPSSGPGPATSPPAGLSVPFTASFAGTQSQHGPDGEGLVSVVITGSFTGPPQGTLRLVLTGEPSDGGVSLTGSQVSLGTSSSPAEFSGHVTQLEGPIVVAALQDQGGRSVTAVIRLELSREGDSVRGLLEVR